MTNRAQILVTAVDQTRSAFASIQGNLRALTDHARSVNGLLGNLGVALSGASFAALVKGSIDAADELDELSQKAGISVEALSTLKLAAQHENVGAEAFATSLKKLSTAMFEAAAGSGENQRLFAALGITFRETNGDLRATDQVLRDLATRFQAMPDGPEKSALAVKLFGKAGTDMIPFLNRGAEGIQELTAQFRELGSEISGETATRAAEFNDDLNLLRAALQGVANRVAASVLPALGDLARGLVESAKTGGSLRAILDGVVWVLKTLALGAAVTGNGFLALGEAMGAGLAAGVAGLKGNVAQAQAILGELETSLAARRDRVIQFHDSLFNPKPVEAKTPEVKPTGESVVGRLARSAGSQDTSGARLALIKANAEAELRLLQDSLKRAQEAYDRAFEDHLVSIRDFHTAKAQIAQAALDAEIAARQQELAEQTKAASTGKDEGARLRAKAEVRKLEAELIVLNRERADVEIDHARKAAKAEADLAKEIAQVRQRLAEIRGGAGGEITREKLAREYQPLLDQLRAAGDEVGEAEVTRLIDVEADLAELGRLESQFNTVMERMRIAEAELEVQRDAGMLTESQMRQDLLTLHQQTAQEVDGLIPRMEALAEATASEEAINRVARLRVEVQGLATESDDVARRIDGAIEDGFVQLFESIGSGAKSAKEAFADFARSVLLAIQKIAAQKLAESLFGSLGKGSGGASLGGWIAGLFRSGFANGGYVTGPGTSTSDSIPARLSAGEYVLNAAAVRSVGVSFLDALNGIAHGPRVTAGRLALAEGGLVEQLKPSAPAGAAPPGVRIVNVVDPSVAHDYLNSSAGERTILNVLARNAGAVKQVLT
ncbi:MAG: phage tail protein [Candidatus Accumulibacter necessarius]|jgi:hypothetical protein|uniref:phage tail protein n=1 Tax=Candidatus Accumulibacter necessarius TaxID=2954386 RepID=UPI002FC3464A